MQLYLMQHGTATSEDENPDRPLTERGRADVTRVASRARSAGVSVGAIVHSGKLRAEQSARILAEALGSSEVSRRDGLAPNDPVGPLAEWLGKQHQDAKIAVVGHQPFLGRLASLLVAADEEAQAIDLHTGGLVALVPKPDRPGFAVTWALVPEIA